MTLTVRGLIAHGELGLSWADGPAPAPGSASGARADRAVTWVHTSELADPTPFLAGGEVLLTTGLRWDGGTSASTYAGYVDRLTAAGVVALGIGTGLSHPTVPIELAAAAAAAGLPLFEVPRATPFIAISRAVSRALAADEYSAVARTFAAQQALTRAALSDAGPQRVVRLLSRQVSAAIAVLDADGTVLHAAPSPGAERAGVLRAEVRALARHPGAVGVAFPAGADTVGLQTIGSGGGRTFLAVARDTPLTADDRHLVNAAVLLLTIRQERAARLDHDRASVPEAVLRTLLTRTEPGRSEAGRPDEAAVDPTRGWVDAVLAAAGTALPAPPWVVAVAGDHAEPTPANGLRCRLGRRVVRLLSAAAGEVAVVASDATPAVRWGFSRPVARTGALPDALDEAEQALAVGERTGRPVTRFADIAATGWGALLPAEQVTAWADALLGPVREHRPVTATAPDGGELLRSLRAWLLHHGQWDPAAAALDIHRHTLRKRLRLVEELLGRSLESPGVRAELWLALEQSPPD